MKKNFFIGIFLVICCGILFWKCSKSDTSSNLQSKNLSIDSLYKDARFQNLVLTLENELNQVKDTSVLKLMASKSTLTDEDINQLSVAFGYSNKEDFINAEIQFSNNIKSLNKDYNLSGKAGTQLFDAVYQTFDQIKTMSKAQATSENSELYGSQSA